MKQKSFYIVLEEGVKNYKGDYHEIIRFCPELYRLLTKMLFDSNLEQKYRSMVLVSVGYFIIPQDLYPEEDLGPVGFIDDLMLLIFVLRAIEEEYGIDELLMYWDDNSENLEYLLREGFDSLLKDNMMLYNEVIDFVGF
jgi:uncharacterized membrane protein YkvA (DUF1232 family)